MTDEELAQRIKLDMKRMRQHSGKWRKEAKECFGFYAGDQWAAEDEAKLKEALRPIITYNRTAPMINAVAGAEISNRQEVTFLPREQGDVQVNEILTGAAHWARDNCDAEDEESDAFIDSLISGMGWTETRLTYDEDPDGKLCIDRIDPIEMYWDTAGKKRNLADCQHVARVKNYDEQEFRAMWPKWADELPADEGAREEEWSENEDEEHFNDEIGYEQEELQAEFNQGRRTYAVIEYQWWEKEPYYRSVNPQSGQKESLSLEAGNKIKDMLDGLGIPIVKQQRRVYHRAFQVGHTVLEREKLPIQVGFTYQCITGTRDRNKRVWYGMVQALKDPQRWANSFFSSILHIISTNARGGVMTESSAVPDMDEFESRWAASDSNVVVEDGALSGGRIQPKPISAYPLGTERMMEHSVNAFKDVTGINMEMLGQSDGNKARSGVMEYQRREAALMILQPVFDSLRRYRKQQGRVLLAYIREYLSDGRLVRILGQNGNEQYLPLVRDDDTVTYDVIVDESPTSPNQRTRTYEILSSILPNLMEMGVPIPPTLLDHVPLPSKLVQDWKQAIEQQSQQGEGDPAAEAKAQSEMMKAQSVAQLNQAKMQTEQAKTQALVQQAQADQAATMAQIQREAELTPVDQAQAEHFQAKAMLERARVLTEEARQMTMLRDVAARESLSAEREETEDARQYALRPPSKPAGANSNAGK
jgi:hypothetical protein